MKGKRERIDSPTIPLATSHHPSATTMEARENELISMAYDAVEERIRNGTATSQELVHFLRLGSMKERTAQKVLEADMELKMAKVQAIQESAHTDELYSKAIEAMRRYNGDFR